MFCSRCAVKNPDGTKFCTQCGSPLETVVEPKEGNFPQPVARGFVLAMTPATGVFIALTVGLLLMVIGFGANEGEVTFAGTFIFILALFWGGLFLEGQRLPVRVTLLVIGGVILLSVFASALAIPW